MAWQEIPVLSDLVDAVVAYSPKVVLSIIVLVIGWLTGRLVVFILNSIVGKIGLEPAFRRVSVGRAILRSGHTPSSFFAAVGRGFVYLLTITSALNMLSIPLLTALVQAFLDYLPILTEGVLILIVGLIFTDWVGEAIEKGTFSGVESYFLALLFRVLLYFMSITIALAHMKIDITILYIFAQASAWGSAIAIGIAFGWYLKDKVGPWLEKILTNEMSDTGKAARET